MIYWSTVYRILGHVAVGILLRSSRLKYLCPSANQIFLLLLLCYCVVLPLIYYGLRLARNVLYTIAAALSVGMLFNVYSSYNSASQQITCDVRVMKRRIINEWIILIMYLFVFVRFYWRFAFRTICLLIADRLILCWITSKLCVKAKWEVLFLLP